MNRHVSSEYQVDSKFRVGVFHNDKQKLVYRIYELTNSYRYKDANLSQENQYPHMSIFDKKTTLPPQGHPKKLPEWSECEYRVRGCGS